MRLFRYIITAVAAISIFSAAASADEARLRAEVMRQIAGNSPWDKADVEVLDVQLQGLDPALAYDALRVNIPKGMGNIGKIGISVTFISGGRETKTIWGSARIRVYRDIVVALNSMSINHRIVKEDLRLARMEARDVPDIAESVEEVTGMLVKRPIPAGAVVKRDYLKPESVVKRGERVVVNVENQKIRIRSAATASEDGCKGAIIAARTPSGKELNGRVTGPGEITVEF